MTDRRIRETIKLVLAQHPDLAARYNDVAEDWNVLTETLMLSEDLDAESLEARKISMTRQDFFSRVESKIPQPPPGQVAAGTSITSLRMRFADETLCKQAARIIAPDGVRVTGDDAYAFVDELTEAVKTVHARHPYPSNEDLVDAQLPARLRRHDEGSHDEYMGSGGGRGADSAEPETQTQTLTH
jgi:hypothetical protein